MIIIGISGKSGSGKDTLYKCMHKLLKSRNITSTKISFANSLKDVASLWFGWDRDRLDHDTLYKEGNTLDDGSIDPSCAMLNMSRRQFMQTFGTEAVRNGICEDFWIKLTRLHIEQGKFNGDIGFITDCRFKNELNFIREMNGNLIRIYTPYERYIENCHISELEWCDWNDWDFVIENTKRDLNEMVIHSNNIINQIMEKKHD